MCKLVNLIISGNTHPALAKLFTIMDANTVGNSLQSRTRIGRRRFGVVAKDQYNLMARRAVDSTRTTPTAVDRSVSIVMDTTDHVCSTVLPAHSVASPDDSNLAAQAPS